MGNINFLFVNWYGMPGISWGKCRVQAGTNRQLFRGHLASATEPPALMFYGIGGVRKSWLLKKLRSEVTEPIVPQGLFSQVKRPSPPSIRVLQLANRARLIYDFFMENDRVLVFFNSGPRRHIEQLVQG